MRAVVAERYGCGPGQRRGITCAYCLSLIVIDRTDPKHTRFLDEKGSCRPELDHIVPVHWGGEHSTDNLVPACMSCNRRKGPRRLEDGFKPEVLVLW